jgi:hypothetical protein
MRTRSKTSLFASRGYYVEDLVWDYTNPIKLDGGIKSISNTNLVYPDEVSVISDDIGFPSEAGRRPERIRRGRFMRPPVDSEGYTPGVTGKSVFGAKECHHTSTKVKFHRKDLTLRHQKYGDFGNPIWEVLYDRTIRFNDGLEFIGYQNGTLLSIMDSHSVDFVSPYLNHDWFALVDQFNESCDQYTRSGFLVGEPMIEHEIFTLALKSVINPSSAIKNLLKATRSIKKYRKMSLGRVAHDLAKGSSNKYLTYTFGIKPAIDDIVDTIDAHSKVSARLRYLRRNAGLFVPIRAKKELLSNCDYEYPSPVAGADDYIKWVTDKHSSTGVISALGKVRSDLSHASDWAAYLQYFGINKVVGLAWELIPFSFVVDWFTNAQERLNSLTRLHIGGPFVEFRNICHSVKLTHQETLVYVPGRDASFGGTCISPSSTTPLATRTVVDYQRNVGLPDTSGVIDFTGLGLFHAITGTALIIQQT